MRRAVLLPALAVAALLTACGADDGGGGSARARPAAKPRPAGPCADGPRHIVAAAASAPAAARVTGVEPGLATCVYTAGKVRVDVRVDRNPQAATRFNRAVEERDQVAIWSGGHQHAPRLLSGIGQGADWFPADRELLATDGRRLLSVTVVRSPRHMPSKLRLARAVAQATLARPG